MNVRVCALQGDERHEFEEPNPFMQDQEQSDVASIGYR